MGGKRQANILASLIENFDVVEDVITTSMNSEGSALAENEKYLDSIQGHLDQLSNATQTLWMNFMDADVVKWIVDLATWFVKLADSIGLIPTALGAFSTFNLVKETIKKDFADIGDEIKNALKISDKEIIDPEVVDAAAEQMKGVVGATEEVTEAKQKQAQANSEATKAAQAGAAADIAGATAEKQKTKAIQQGTNATKQNTNAQVQNVATDRADNAADMQGAATENVETAAIHKNTAATVANTVAQKAGHALLSLGKGLLAGVGAGILSWGVGAVIGLVVDAFQAEEKAIERANEALNTYNEEHEKLKDQKKTVDELAETYTRLSPGVNTLTNDNIGLTVESYQEYLEVCNDIADMFPELISGFDAQGNAIIDLKGDVDQLTESYIRAQKEAANTLLTDKNKKDIWKTVDGKNGLSYKTYNASTEGGAYEKLPLTMQETHDMMKVILSMPSDMFEDFYEAAGTDEMWDILRTYLEQLGMFKSDDYMRGVYWSMPSQAQNFSGSEEFKESLTHDITDMNQAMFAGTSGIQSLISASLLFNPIYEDLNEESRKLAQAMISSIDLNMIASSGADDADEFIEWFSENVIDSIANNEDMYRDLTNVSNKMAKAMLDGDQQAFKAAQNEFMGLIPKYWLDASGNVVVDPDADPVTQYLQQLAIDTQDKAKNFEVRLEIRADIELQPKKPIKEVIEEQTESAKKELKDAVTDLESFADDNTLGDIFDTISVQLDGGKDGEKDGKLRADELQDAYDDYIDYLSGNDEALEGWTEPQIEAMAALHALCQMYGTDIATITDEMIEAGYAFKSLDGINSFDLASESTNEFVDKFQSDIDDIRGAWESLNSGEMTQSEFLDLAQEFPELMEGVDFSDDNWMTQAKANMEALNTTTVDEFITELSEMKDAMIARGEDTAVIDSMIAWAEKSRDLSQIAGEVQADTVTGLTEVHERYKSIMEETNEILYNGQKVSDGYYESLAEYIDDTDALNACFDENNKQIVTNVDALKELIDKQHEADVQTVRLAKSQSQFRYYELVRQLGDTTRSMTALSAASDTTVDSLLDQIRIVKDTISQYQLLEDNLLGTTSAFERFAKAQELDEQNTYGASYAEMAQTMYDALYETGQVGSAQFWAAVEGTVPDDIYKHLTPGPEQIRAIYDYFNKNIMPTLTFDEDSFSIDYTDMESFIKKAQEVGVFTGTDATSFGLSSDFLYGLEDGENALKEFAKRMGMTTTQVYAMLSEMDKYTTDGTGLSMLLQLDTSTSGQITYITSELEKLYAQRRALLGQGASDSVLEANMAKIYQYEGQLAGLQKQASDTVQDYIVVQNALVDTSKTVREALPEEIWRTELQLTGDETVGEVLQQINDYVLTLKEPTVMELEIASQSIDDELSALIDQYSEKELEANVVLNEDGLYEIKDGNLTIDTATLDRYVDLKNAQLFIDDTLLNSMSAQEQLLTNIDKNVATIAGADSVSDNQASGTTLENSTTKSSRGTIDAHQSEKPAPDKASALLTLDTGKKINNFAEAISDEFKLTEVGSMKSSELGRLHKEAMQLQEDLYSGKIFAEDARAQLSELQTEAAKWGVQIPATLIIEPEEIETSTEEAADGPIIKQDVNESQEALDGLNSVMQEATSEAEALYGVYASPEEALAALEAIEDKTYELTPEEAMAFGWQLAEGEILTVADAIARVKQEQDALRQTSVYNPEQFQESVTMVKTLSELQEEVSNYNETLAQTEEIISDNIEVSQEYKDSLKELGITEEDLNACFDDSNPLLVTNSRLLNKLVKDAKNNVATNVRLAKSQAQLEYYELYKEMAKLTDGTQEIDGATLDYIQSLYGQMGAIQKNIAQFSMLEAQLLGTTNAYEKLEEAQAIDSANDYGSRAEELVNILGNAFNTAELGTQAAQTAIAGLVPESVYADVTDLDDKMQHIYEYFTDGPVSKLFTIEFDDEGNISSVDMTKENVEEFTKSLIGSAESGAVFQGTWDEFTLNPAIETMDDFAAALGVTREVAFAYLTELEKYDINWLGGDHETLLDKLMGDDFDYQIQKTVQRMAQLQQEKASLMEGGITADEQKRINEINAELKQLDNTMAEHKETAYDTWQEYSVIDGVLTDANNLGKKVSEVFSSDLIAKVGLTGDETVEEAYDKLLAYQIKLGQPTELVLQLASEQAMAEMDTLKSDLESSTGIDIEANVHFNTDTGEFEYTGSQDGWTDEDNAKLERYLDLSGDLYDINQSLGLGIEAMEGYAQRTADAVESIDQKLTGNEYGETKYSKAKEQPKTPTEGGFFATAASVIDQVTDGADTDDAEPSASKNITAEEATVVADQVTVEASEGETDSNEQVLDSDDTPTAGQLTTQEATVVSDNTVVETTSGTTDLDTGATGNATAGTASEFTGAQVIVTTITESENGVTLDLPSIASLPAYVGEYKEIDGGANKDGVEPLTTAKVGGYQLGSYVLGKESINPNVTGNVIGYNPPDDGVATNNIDPSVTGVVGDYKVQDGGAPTTNVNPSVTGNVTGYTPPSQDVDITNIDPSVTGKVSGYTMSGDDVSTSNVNPDVTGIVGTYDEVQNGADKSKLSINNITGYVSGYEELPDVTLDSLQTSKITARIVGYDDTGAALPEVVVGNNATDNTGSNVYHETETDTSSSVAISTPIANKDPSMFFNAETWRLIQQLKASRQALSLQNGTWDGDLYIEHAGVAEDLANAIQNPSKDGAPLSLYSGLVPGPWRTSLSDMYFDIYSEMARLGNAMNDGTPRTQEEFKQYHARMNQLEHRLNILNMAWSKGETTHTPSVVLQETTKDDATASGNSTGRDGQGVATIVEVGAGIDPAMDREITSINDGILYLEYLISSLNMLIDDASNGMQISDARIGVFAQSYNKFGTWLDGLSSNTIDANMSEDINRLNALIGTFNGLLGVYHNTVSNGGSPNANQILSSLGLGNLPLDKALYDAANGDVALDPTIFTQVLTEAKYTEQEINDLMQIIGQYRNVVASPSNPDPLGLHDASLNAALLKSALDDLGVSYKDEENESLFDGVRNLRISVPEMRDVLQKAGWTETAIDTYITQLWNIDLDGYQITPYVPPIAYSSNVNIDIDEATQHVTDINDMTINDKEFSTTANGASEAMQVMEDINDYKISDKSYEIKTTYTKEYKTIGDTTKKEFNIFDPTTWFASANGTAHAQGTAHKGGSWGAPKTETALTGELGPELRVRGNRWELLGEHGAEFNEVRKGDIIFNHKQTEQLLSNGYITGRGKAFAEGTIGGSAFAGINTWDDAYGTLGDDYGNRGSDAADDLLDAASDAADEFREVFDWIAVRIEEINEKINLKGAELENAVGSYAQNAVIDDMIALNQKLYDNLTAGAAKYNAYAAKLLAKVPAEYRKAAQNGTIAIEAFVGEVDEETLNAIQEYREWVQKGADATQQAEETLTEISNLAKQAIDNIAQDYENKSSFGEGKIGQLEAYNALIETDIGYESAGIYQAMIAENNRNIGILEKQRDAMQAELNKRVESGEIKVGSQNWYDAINAIAAVDTEIIDLKTNTENWQDAINDLHWEKFDSLIGRLQSVSEEADNLIDILGNSDMVDEAGNWTDEGITSLGLYAQQMEAAEVEAKKYQDEIDYLNNNWQKLGYTEDEYLERLGELKDGQYAAIKSYHDSKDAIVDMTKARVDAIKEGIEKEIEAYEELISKKKEELDAEKDLYDFQKGVANQQKNIAEIQRKLAALSSDNSAAARAQRAQLEAELAEAQAELSDTYYDRSVSNQQDALDKELDAFREEKDNEMEGWDEYLENTNQVVSDCLATVQENTETVYNTLQALGEEYGLSITESLTSPWAAGEDAIDSFTERFGDSMSATVEELQQLEVEFLETMANIELAGADAAQTVRDNFKGYKEAEKAPEQPSGGGGSGNGGGGGGSSAAGMVSSLSGNIQYGQSGDKVKKLQQALNALGFNCGNVDGIFGVNTLAAVKKFQQSSKYGGAISADGIVGANTKKKFKTAGYASGTTGVKSNQFALIDELGEELVIRSSKGRMTFMEKGTGVVPADLTSNLMEWGELDPSIMLERNKPVISAPHVTNNNIEINMEFGEVVHIDTVTNDTIPNLTKAIEKQMDKYMKNVNNNIRKYAR